jgi:hypothetical protein
MEPDGDEPRRFQMGAREGCQIFIFAQYTQTEKNITKLPQHYLMQ